MVEEFIDSILDKYYNEDGDYYYRYREDGEVAVDVELEDELKAKNIKCEVMVTDGFDSPGYECSVLSIAYIDPSNNNLELLTVLLESY